MKGLVLPSERCVTSLHGTETIGVSGIDLKRLVEVFLTHEFTTCMFYVNPLRLHRLYEVIVSH